MKRIAQYFAVFIVGLLGVTATAIGLARTTLPKSACTITENQTEMLKLEVMHYADVMKTLGCEGVLVSRTELGEFKFETYAWQGAAWPYGMFKGEFINGELHGTEKRWITLQLSAN